MSHPTTAYRPAAAPSIAHRHAASPFHIPGHAIFIADPLRLSVLSVSIDATTTIVTSRASNSRSHDPALPSQSPFPLHPASPPSNSVYPSQPPNAQHQHHASTSKARSPFPPVASSSYHASASKSSRSRPLSQEIGQRARDALNEFGRLATRRTSAMERSNAADTLAQVADGLHSSPSNIKSLRRATLQPSLPQTNISQPTTSRVERSPALRLASDDAVVVTSSCTRTFSLVPQSPSHHAFQTVPLDIRSRLVTSDATASVPSAVEFISDPSYASAIFDPTLLLLKVRPPAELARESWSRSASFLTAQNASGYDTSESQAITLRFRLRLAAGPTTPTSSSLERSETIATEPRAANRDTSRQVLFLSASSPHKLADAIASPQSSISTAELASLEGITRVPVSPSNNAMSPTVARGPSDSDFEWAWKSLSRTSSGQPIRCCCAFVELYADGWKASVLSAFSFHVELPDASTALTSMSSSNQASSTCQGGSPRADSLAIIAALNFGTDVSPRTESKPLSISSPSHAFDGPYKGTDGTPLRTASGPLPIDRTELALEDIVNDSPIFRASVANLERRTAALKKHSKSMLKAAQEARLRLVKLIEAEQAMDGAYHDLAAMAPQTLGTLHNNFMRQARQRISHHRSEQVMMIETCLERPLSQTAELCRVALESFKLFDNESKSYYSQTQKWLASRSEAPTSDNGQALASSAVASDKAPKHERADDKQKLRELRFEQARLDLFAMMQRLHGGKAEAHLAQCFLQLSQWLADLPTSLFGSQWAAHEHKFSLSSLGIRLQSTLDSHAAQLSHVEARSRQLGYRIRNLEQALGKLGETDSDIVGAHRFNLEQETPQTPQSNGAVSAKARKFRAFLGSFAAGINNSPRPSNHTRVLSPGEAELQKQADHANTHDRPQKVDAHRRLSLKLKSERIQRSDRAPSLPSPALAPFHWSLSDAPATPRRGTELLPAEVSENLASSWHAASDHARIASDVGWSSAAGNDSEFKHADRGLGIFAPASPAVVHATEREAVPTPSAGAVAPNTLPGGERKKEGVLWVMSKPVTGPAGADAPRGVNRSAHWRECWVVLSGSGQISEFADWKDAKALEPSNPLIDLRFATVREARGVDRRFAFEVVTRDNRRFFQAQDEETMRDWMRAISKAIESLLNGTSSVRKLDRAVPASPFRNLDAAQRGDTLDEDEEDPGAGEGDDFAVRRLMDRSSKGLSQSMTDLSATAKAQAADRRDQAKLGAHLSVMSESHADSSNGSSKRRSHHLRGISNKTPISGYLGGGVGGLGLSAADAAASYRQVSRQGSEEGGSSSFSGHGEHDIEFDRQIEANVHRNYGSYDECANSQSGVSNTSGYTGVDEMGLLKGNSTSAAQAPSSSPTKGSSGFSCRQRGVVNGSGTTSTSTKMSRAAEIAAISRLPENRQCADCRERDPRWASWMRSELA